jgi:hypothetical protein
MTYCLLRKRHQAHDTSEPTFKVEEDAETGFQSTTDTDTHTFQISDQSNINLKQWRTSSSGGSLNSTENEEKVADKSPEPVNTAEMISDTQTNKEMPMSSSSSSSSTSSSSSSSSSDSDSSSDSSEDSRLRAHKPEATHHSSRKRRGDGKISSKSAKDIDKSKSQRDLSKSRHESKRLSNSKKSDTDHVGERERQHLVGRQRQHSSFHKSEKKSRSSETKRSCNLDRMPCSETDRLNKSYKHDNACSKQSHAVIKVAANSKVRGSERHSRRRKSVSPLPQPEDQVKRSSRHIRVEKLDRPNRGSKEDSRKSKRHSTESLNKSNRGSKMDLRESSRPHKTKRHST